MKDDVKFKIEEKNVERPLGGKTTRYTCSNYPFKDSHDKTYNVRAKNIIFFLSRHTENSKALREEIEYGINVKGLPVGGSACISSFIDGSGASSGNMTAIGIEIYENVDIKDYHQAEENAIALAVLLMKEFNVSIDKV